MYKGSKGWEYVGFRLYFKDENCLGEFNTFRLGWMKEIIRAFNFQQMKVAIRSGIFWGNCELLMYVGVS